MRIQFRPHRLVRSRPGRIVLWVVVALLAIPAAELLFFRFVDPPLTPFMLARRCFPEKGKKIRQFRHQPVTLEEVGHNMIFAVLASEDQNYLSHSGFDLPAIEMALRHNRTHRRKLGASTISQQTAKNVFLWEGRSWLRKGLEVPLTLALELLWGKRRILEVYLNVAEFGPGVFGVEAAARHWFHVPAGRLSRRQAALLAASLPSPLRFRPDMPSSLLARRASWIEGQVRNMDQAAVLEGLNLRKGRSRER